MTEEWADVPGHEGIYEVSDLGQVRSKARLVQYRDGRHRPVPARIMKAYPVRGYQGIKLYTPRRTTYVHTLVCEAFYGPRPSLEHEVRHLNGVRTDNRRENLTWGTRSENRKDTVRHGMHVYARRTTCPKGHPYDRKYGGNRRCSICQNAANQRCRDRKKAA